MPTSLKSKTGKQQSTPPFPAKEGTGLGNSLPISKSSTEKVHVCVCTVYVCVCDSIQAKSLSHSPEYNVSCVHSTGDAQWLLAKHQEISLYGICEDPTAIF